MAKKQIQVRLDNQGALTDVKRCVKANKYPRLQ